MKYCFTTLAVGEPYEELTAKLYTSLRDKTQNCEFFITTNKSEPIATSNGDRRNLIIRSSDELCAKTKKNVEYFNKLRQYLDDDNVIATCYNYFKSIPNLDKFNEIPIPKTEYQENLKQLSLSPPEQFIKELVSNET